MVRTDLDGNRVWQKTFGEDVFDSPSDVILLGSDGYAVTGFTFSWARVKEIFGCSKSTIMETSCVVALKKETTLKKPTTFAKLANRNLF